LGDITLMKSSGSGIYMFLDLTTTKELAFLNFVKIKNIEDLLKQRHSVSAKSKQICCAHI